MFLYLSYTIETLLNGRIDFVLSDSWKLRSDAILHQTDSTFEKLYGSVDTLTNTQLASTQHLAPIDIIGQLLDVVFHSETIEGTAEGVNALDGTGKRRIPRKTPKFF